MSSRKPPRTRPVGDGSSSDAWSTGWHSFDDLDDEAVVGDLDELIGRARRASAFFPDDMGQDRQ